LKQCKQGHSYVAKTKNNRLGCSVCNKERKIANKEHNAQYMRKWWAKNSTKKAIYDKKARQTKPEVFNQKSRTRQANQLKRMPKWLSKLQKQHIQMFYTSAKQLQNELGIKMHVDHIIPLQGKLVSGLHVPWNLQVLSAVDNVKKSNK